MSHVPRGRRIVFQEQARVPSKKRKSPGNPHQRSRDSSRRIFRSHFDVALNSSGAELFSAVRRASFFACLPELKWKSYSEGKEEPWRSDLRDSSYIESSRTLHGRKKIRLGLMLESPPPIPSSFEIRDYDGLYILGRISVDRFSSQTMGSKNRICERVKINQ